MKASDWQAIIFDFDGVVAESGKIKTQAFAELYQSYGEKLLRRLCNTIIRMAACHAIVSFIIISNIFWINRL